MKTGVKHQRSNASGTLSWVRRVGTLAPGGSTTRLAFETPFHGATKAVQRISIFKLGLLLVGTVALMGPAFRARAFASETNKSTAITVLVFNFRQVSTDILSNAENEAGQIFGNAGMQVVWQECPTGNEPCRIGPGPVLFLAIKAGPVQNKFLDVVSGQAIVANQLAVVYYDALPRVGRGKTGTHEASTLLACVIAHELGHLLLGAYGHSIHGIMRDRWDIEQTRVALMSELDFLPEEGELMRRALREGTQPGGAAQSALVSSH